MIVGIIVAILVIIATKYIITINNRIRKYQAAIEESKKAIEIVLTQRYQILIEMCKIAKSCTPHEEVFSELVDTHIGTPIEEINIVIKNQEQVFSSLKEVSNNYSQLCSNQLYKNLQEQIVSQEEQFAASKRCANSNISRMNAMLSTFPSNIVCFMLRLQRYEFLTE